MRRRVLGALFLSCGLSSGIATAQLWRGAAALEVQVDDASGKPAAGAKVALLFQAVEPKAGPPVVTTDALGRALFVGLADGWWALAVRREGALTFHAEIVLSGEKKPAVLSTFQENAPNAKETLRVRVGKPRPGANEARAPREEKVTKPAAPPPPAAVEKTVASQAPISSEKKEAPVAPPPPAAATPPVDSRHPISSEKGTAQAPVPTAPAAPPPAAQAPPPAATPPPPPPTQQTAPPVPQATPPPPSPTQQTAPPVPQAPPPEATPPASVLRRSYADRTCFECKPGEASLTVEAIGLAGGSGCGPDVASLLSPSAFSSSAATPPLGCALLKIELPTGARFTGYRYEVEEGGRAKDCVAGKDCPQGDCAWPLDPLTQRKGGATTLTAAFENRAVDRERRARFTVYFADGER